ncbi:methylated-DNA--[protein]-cysteine S-methyltransferase [Hamadaea sp.]|uniref:methylated-DNA--[protein]-cysteine S-methyltransferase n=1 Tax=Hamadaea sp. TaxID=2024425 RepID=UPI0025C0E0C3|nr:methylated-DNA--[protein]-cysteine S-methyltransferase [Hamadaea sp.]
MEFAWLSVPTPLVPLTVAATDDGLACVSFDGSGATVRSLARHGGVRPASASDVLASASDVLVGAAGQQIAEWASGRRQVFDLPIDWSLTSGPQERVLRTLYETVPFGTTITYGELAARSGLPDGSARLVGQIMGSNPIPVVVPCHRVLASDGLGGYGPGIELKRRILVLEGVLQPSLFD